ncbi:hypothetical protein ACSBR1_009813 [Camellia fascicularis]
MCFSKIKSENKRQKGNYIYKQSKACDYSLLLVVFFHHRIILDQVLYFIGLANTTSTFASAMENSVPAITFLLAAIFRQHSLKEISKHGKFIPQVNSLLSSTCIIGAVFVIAGLYLVVWGKSEESKDYSVQDQDKPQVSARTYIRLIDRPLRKPAGNEILTSSTNLCWHRS